MPLFATNSNRNARPVLSDVHLSHLTNTIIPAYLRLMEEDAATATEHGDERLAELFRRQAEQAKEMMEALDAMESD